MQQKNMQPIYIMPEGTQRATGKSAQRDNITAAKLTAEAVRTTLGPKGMDKMLVDNLGEITISNDGATILKEMQIEHPAAKMMVEIAKTQEQEVGDGTTTAVIIAGELLKKAEDLMDQKVHPSMIIKGYQLAETEAQKLLSRELGLDRKCQAEDLVKVAMTGKCSEEAMDLLSDMVVRAVNATNGDTKSIKVVTCLGADVSQSKLIDGIVLSRRAAHPNMFKLMTSAKMIIINADMMIDLHDKKVQFNTNEELEQYVQKQSANIKSKIDKAVDAGFNLLISEKEIDNVALNYLNKRGMVAVQRVPKADTELLSKAFGVSVCDLEGDAPLPSINGTVQYKEEKVGEETFVFIQSPTPKAVTIFLRGATEHFTAEIKRAIDDGVGVAAAYKRNPKLVYGAGAVEIELAKHLRHYAQQLKGKKQVAVNAFADAIEIVPRTLAENAGLDPIDVLANLRSMHNSNNLSAGVYVDEDGELTNSEPPILEPLEIKTQAIKAAMEVATMILRIDDVIAAVPATAQGA